jgi:hypothetical protein
VVMGGDRAMVGNTKTRPSHVVETVRSCKPSDITHVQR